MGSEPYSASTSSLKPPSEMSPILLHGTKIGGSDPWVITQRVNRVEPGPNEQAARSPRRHGRRCGKHAAYLETPRRQLIPDRTVSAARKQRPRRLPLKRSPSRSLPLDVHGWM